MAPLRQPARPQFPWRAARLYLTSGQPQPRGLGNLVAPAGAAAIAQAKQELQAATAQGGKGAAATRERALAEFVLGKGEAERGETGAAAPELEAAAAWTPARNAAAAALVDMWAQNDDPQQTLAAADRYAPAAGDAFAAEVERPAARAAGQLQRWDQALRWTRPFPDDPEMLWLRAQADEALGRPGAAAPRERKLVYEFPASPEARAAAGAWRRHLRADRRLAPDWRMIAREANAWRAAGRPKEEAEAWTRAAGMAPRRERARLEARETRAWLAAGHMMTTATGLRRLVHTSERAQALELEIELARHRDRPEEIAAPLTALAQEYPRSRWYERGLEQAADQALLGFHDALTQERFDQLTQAFPHGLFAARAAWRSAWIAFRLNLRDAPRRLDNYLREYPHTSAAVDAIFWRGVWAQQHQQPQLAQLCFRTAARRFPGTFFGQQAKLRTESQPGEPDPATPNWLQPFLRERAAPIAGAIPPGHASEAQRAEWMSQAGLLDPAEKILNHVLYRLPAGPASLQLARTAGKVETENGDWDEALRGMIRALPHYLELQPDQLRPSDWKLLFPAPYPADIAAAAAHFGLNQSLVLGLIRQESGFDPESVSSAHARGLMQLELGTARQMLELLPENWRRLKGPGRLSASDLFQPGLNLALGTAELHQLLEEFNAPAYALAGYNAGRLRVEQWQQQYPGMAMDAFIESVPFTQTRDYIQAVLRNATRYREIYGQQP